MALDVFDHVRPNRFSRSDLEKFSEEGRPCGQWCEWAKWVALASRDSISSGLSGSPALTAALHAIVACALAVAATSDGITFDAAEFEPRPDTGERTETGFVHRVSCDAIFWHD